MTKPINETNPFLSSYFTLDALCIIYEALEDVFHSETQEDDQTIFPSKVTIRLGSGEQEEHYEYDLASDASQQKETIGYLISDILDAMDTIEARENAPDMICDIEDFLRYQNPR